LANWLRDDLQEVMVENLTDRYFLEQGFFEPAAIAGLLNDHLSRRADHSRLLWNLLMFAMFHVEQ
jgi:asparagine synthase (glutamine-hydrolysing)